MSLTERQIRFAHRIVAGWDAQKAYISAGYSENGAAQSAYRLLRDPEIKSEMDRKREELAELAGIDQNWVLKQWKQIAEADPSELIRTSIVNCRHCYGADHKFQWKQAEFESELNAALDSQKTKNPKPMPDGAGGFGFLIWRDPNPECPVCEGKGEERTQLADTRKVSPAARRLYAGMKITKDGVQILFRDQDASLKNIAQYVGMVIERGELSGPGGRPLEIAPVSVDDLTMEQLAAIALTAKNESLTIEGDVG